MRKNLLFCLSFLAAIFVNAQNDNCSGATTLSVGTSFASGAVTSTNVGATTDGTIASCDSDAAENVWFKVVVPASGKLTIETREVSTSLFDDSVLTVYSGACGNLTEVDCDDDGGQGTFSLLSLTGQTPGTTLYISVWKYDSTVDSGEFQISAYDPVPPANDNCSGAVTLTVGTNFASGAITSTNIAASTDGTAPSCSTDAVENVWYKVIVPPSGNLTIEAQETSGSQFDDSVLTVYSGSCGSLTQVACDDDSGTGLFSLLTLTGQTPGATLYISAWKYDSSVSGGEFQISAYDSSALSTNEVAGNKNKIKVSPNPFTDLITISDASDVKSVTVLDASGKLIKTIEKPSSSLYLGDLKAGVYLLTLKMNDGTVKTIKTIKK
ncbi:T9SS type A sorting domain-containing protein [Chryseobacterium daecheongense]|uniref:T9SS type A sorting domain-containing protein n=1 Tax=Chryseobacterium daecheongense TaxID=192389 RepID=UPI001FD6D05B|nr:T9SS type A sorting domain-containing protein [Chryseobacterium daecheongense]UOV00066.1 T9SS type A sorting domain-containing protein [Chryseobacterium daecheongense]